MIAVPIHLRAANEFVRQFHRHSRPTVGGKFAVGAEDDHGKLIGVAIAGRPLARELDDGRTLEIIRVATDGTPNANSFLYGRVRQIARLFGYTAVVTYTLTEESGASLRAVGATPTAPVKGRSWDTPARPRQDQEVYTKDKVRWQL